MKTDMEFVCFHAKQEFTENNPKTANELLTKYKEYLNPDEFFLQAIEENRLEIVDFILKNNWVKRFKDSTAIELASQKGHIDVVKLLLKENDDPRMISSYFHDSFDCYNNARYFITGWDLKKSIKIAYDNGYLEVTSLLISAYYKYPHRESYIDNYGIVKEIFYKASRDGHLELVKLFASQNMEAKVIQNGLLYAIQCKHILIVEHLLADDRIELNSDSFENPLVSAAATGDLRLVEIISKDYRLDLKKSGSMALSKVCSTGHVKIFNYLIEKGLLPTQEHLISAAEKKQHEILYRIIELNIMDSNEILGIVSKHGVLEVVKFLLNQSDIDPKSRYSECLRLAASNGQDDVVKVLLEDKRAEPQAMYNQAIRAAVKNKHIKVVEFLLADERVDPQARGSEALRIASTQCTTEIFTLLLKNPRVDPANCQEMFSFSTKWTSNIGNILLQDKRFDKAIMIFPLINLKQTRYILDKCSIQDVVRFIRKYEEGGGKEPKKYIPDLTRKLINTLGIFARNEFLPKEITFKIAQDTIAVASDELGGEEGSQLAKLFKL